MSTLEATVSMPEVLTKEQILDQLDVSRQEYEAGDYLDAEVFEAELMRKYLK